MTWKLVSAIAALGAVCGCQSLGGRWSGRSADPETVLVIRHLPPTAPDSGGIWVISNGRRQAVRTNEEVTVNASGRRRGHDSVMVVVKAVPASSSYSGFRTSTALVVINSAIHITATRDTTERVAGALSGLVMAVGARAAAKYGSRASGGVLEIATTAPRPR